MPKRTALTGTEALIYRLSGANAKLRAKNRAIAKAMRAMKAKCLTICEKAERDSATPEWIAEQIAAIEENDDGK
jgi:hypothetical protein